MAKNNEWSMGELSGFLDPLGETNDADRFSLGRNLADSGKGPGESQNQRQDSVFDRESVLLLFRAY